MTSEHPDHPPERDARHRNPGRGLPLDDRTRLVLNRVGLVAAIIAIVLAVPSLIYLAHLGWFVIVLGVGTIATAVLAVIVNLRALAERRKA